MNSGRFDALTRSLAAGRPRRAVFRLAAGAAAGIFGGLAARAGAQEAPAVAGGEGGSGTTLLNDDGAGLAIADASGGNRNAAVFCQGCPPCRACDAGGGCAPDPDQDGRNCDPGNDCQQDGTCRDGRCEGKNKDNGDRCGSNTNQVCCDGQCCAPGRECRGGSCQVVSSSPPPDNVAPRCSGPEESCETDADCCDGLFCLSEVGICVPPL